MDVVPRTIYSPIPEMPPADSELWSRRHPLPGLSFDVDAQWEAVAALEPFLREYGEQEGVDPWNGQYNAGDAELLYAMLRQLKPARVLELGSGFSTMIASRAVAANATEGSPADLVAVDPAPRADFAAAGTANLARSERTDARDLPLSRFDELRAGDVLFIDTSHTVKLGSEVNWLVLEVLPRLAPGVYVHFHDIFLPYEYPRYLIELGACFNEQYLLHAFLLGNPDWEIVFGACVLARERRGPLTELIPSIASVPAGQPADYTPAALWIRRRR